MLQFALLPGGADDAQRGAVAAGGQRSGVAVGKQRDARREQGRAVGADAAAGVDVLFVDADRLRLKSGDDIRGTLSRDSSSPVCAAASRAARARA